MTQMFGHDCMDIFNIIAGIASIVSLVIGIISFVWVKETRDTINSFKNSDRNKVATDNSGQVIQADNTNGGIVMSGRDVRK